MVFCSKCGTEMKDEDDVFCSRCGAKLKKNAMGEVKKDSIQKQAPFEHGPTRAPSSIYEPNYMLIFLLVVGIGIIFVSIVSLDPIIAGFGFIFMLLIVIISTIIVYLDALSIGMSEKEAIIESIVVLLFWIITLPIYLYYRKRDFEKYREKRGLH